MTVAIQADRDGDHARLVPIGSFDLAHAVAAARAVEDAEPLLAKCSSIDVDLAQLDRVDGAGAVLLARLLDRLDSHGRHPNLIEGANHEAARLIARYRERRAVLPTPDVHAMSPLMRIGALAAHLPGKANEALDFTGRCAIALPKAAAATSSVDWHSLPKLIQEIGADGILVASSANLLIGFIIGFLGVGQLARFGAVDYVPQLVAVAQLRELGPLITAIVVAARSGAGIASEIATMKVAEELRATWLLHSRNTARRPANGDFLYTTAEEPRFNRHGYLHHGQCLRPGCLQRRSPQRPSIMAIPQRPNVEDHCKRGLPMS